MKFGVFLLFLAALGKVGTVEYLARTGSLDVIANAYTAQAAASCMRQAVSIKAGLTERDWAKGAAVRAVTGNRALSVPLWQVDNAAWRARYQNPFLVLNVEAAGSRFQCDFDVANSRAAVFVL